METDKRNTTAITNWKTKSQNTTANTTVKDGRIYAGKTGSVSENTNDINNTRDIELKEIYKGGKMATTNNNNNKGRQGMQSPAQNQRSKAGQSKTMQDWTQPAQTKQAGWNAGSKNWSNTQQAKNWGSRQNKNWNAAANKSCPTTAEFSEEMCKLNDADIISDILASHKGLFKLYGTAMVEVDCEQLRDIITTQMSECADDQFDAFLYMNQRGMYPTDPAPMPKIKQAKKHFGSLEQTFKI